MKKIFSIFASITFASAIFFACTGNDEISPIPPDCELLGTCGSEISSDSNEPDPISSFEPGSSSQSIDPGNSSNSVINSSSSFGIANSSSGGIGVSSSTPVAASSSSGGGVSSSVPASSSSIAVVSCSYKPEWCKSISFSDVITASQNGNVGDGPKCVFATAISKMGNQSREDILVNGITLTGSGNVDVGGRCGNTDWGQRTCSEALSAANVQKADGGYYIYVAEWVGDFTTTGGTPSCGGTNPGTSSSSRANSSSSNTSTTYTLTCTGTNITATANQAITSRPTVRCSDNVTVNSNNVAWSSNPNWDSPAVGTYSSIRAQANTGNCNGQSATCTGTITVNAATTQSSSGGSSSYVPKAPGNSTGATTQYWDACKPSCSWGGKGGKQANSCSITGSNIGHNDMDKSACDGGNAFACMFQAPWKVGNVSFGYVAVNDGACGDCFQLDFPNGEVMVVMKSNIGNINGKFDIMIPGGGVGDFDALTKQVQNSGISNPNMGERYGGFRLACKNDVSCVRDRCNSVFANLPDLKAGCLWYVNTLGTNNASFDNPSVKYQSVTCPKELTDKF